jgi:hypothetical protein
MFTNFIRAPAPSRRLALVLALAAGSLAACGGGGEGLEPDSTYSDWTNNANGVVILDANNDRFAVRRDNDVLADYMTDTQLIGITVDDNGGIWYRGSQIGSVVSAPSASGGRIAAMRCLDGRSMDITFSASTNTWTQRCV